MKYLLSAFSFLLCAFSFSARAQCDFTDIPYLSIAMTPATASSPITLESTANGVAVGNSPFSLTFSTSGNNRYLLVFYMTFGGNAPSSVSFNGSAMTLVVARTNSFNTDLKAFMYGLVAPSTGVHSVDITPTGPPGDHIVIAADWNNVNQSTPISGTQTNESDTAASPSALTISSATGRMVMSGIAVIGVSAAPTAGGSQTQLSSTSVNASSAAAAYITGAASVSCPYTYTSSTKWVELAASMQQ